MTRLYYGWVMLLTVSFTEVISYDLLGTYSLIFWALAGLSALAAGAILLIG